MEKKIPRTTGRARGAGCDEDESHLSIMRTTIAQNVRRSNTNLLQAEAECMINSGGGNDGGDN